jgi:ribose transport system substrate-binding protein
MPTESETRSTTRIGSSRPFLGRGVLSLVQDLRRVGRLPVLGMLLLCLVAACSHETGSREPHRRHLVGLAMHFTFDDYAKTFMGAFSSVLEPTDVLYEIADASADGDHQADQIRAFSAKRVDALVVVPISDSHIVGAVNEAAALGIPVITVTDIPGARVVATIPGNDRPNGAAAAELLVEQLGGNGEVVVFGARGHAHRIDERLAGFDEVTSQTDLDVVETCDSVSPPFIIDETLRILSDRPTVRGVFGVAGVHAESVATALRMMGRHDVVLTAVDANKEVLRLIEEGYVTGVAAQYPWMHGEYAAKISLDVVHGKPPRPIPEMPTIVITARNVDLGAKLLGPHYAEATLMPALTAARP